MENRKSLPCSQQLSTGSCLESHESSLHIRFLNRKVRFHAIDPYVSIVTSPNYMLRTYSEIVLHCNTNNEAKVGENSSELAA